MDTRLFTRNRYISLSLIPLVALFAASVAFAQGTAFTYQGRLTESGNPANGNYDMQFKLFNTQAVGTGTQQGSTLTNSTVLVTNGSFTVQLDFGAAVFDGSVRFLEISVRPSGSINPYTVLTPRQSITSTPYTIRSLSAANADTATNATQLGGIAASGFIKNTSSQQAMTNFNISGNGTVGGTLSANTVNAETQYDLGGVRILSRTGTANLFAGLNAGASNAGGSENAFFGHAAGASNTIGGLNAFFGTSAGQGNTTGTANAFFGRNAGYFNTTGSDNSFFGTDAGTSNTTGNYNSFFGTVSGNSNTTGFRNAFFGHAAGRSNTAGTDNAFFGAWAGEANTASGNAFFGSDAGRNNTTGFDNAFFGESAGFANTTATFNSFFGRSAGRDNTTGASNSFFGRHAGLVNTTGFSNSFFGSSTGVANTTGNQNAFFGASAGFNNTTGNGNAFFGQVTGFANTTGYSNAFFGKDAGSANTIGCCNAYFGAGAGRTSTASFNSFFGYNAGESNTSGTANSFFGTDAGQNNTTGDNNAFFGYLAGLANTTGTSNSFFGREAGAANIDGVNNTFIGRFAGTNSTTGSGNTFVGRDAGLTNTTGSDNTYIGHDADGSAGITNATAIGANAFVNASNTMVLGTSAVTVRVPGTLIVSTLGAAGSTSLCRNASNQISTCSSSLRYKERLQPWRSGLEVIERLRPITFIWKESGERDLGLAAEQVFAVEPLLATRNSQGEIEGVKYEQLSVVLINAVRQQQEQIKQQQNLIDRLVEMVCADHPRAAVCRSKKWAK